MKTPVQEGQRKYRMALWFLAAAFVMAMAGIVLGRTTGAALLISTMAPYLITFTIGNVREHVAKNGRAPRRRV